MVESKKKAKEEIKKPINQKDDLAATPVKDNGVKVIILLVIAVVIIIALAPIVILKTELGKKLFIEPMKKIFNSDKKDSKDFSIKFNNNVKTEDGEKENDTETDSESYSDNETTVIINGEEVDLENEDGSVNYNYDNGLVTIDINSKFEEDYDREVEEMMERYEKEKEEALKKLNSI